MIGITLIGCQQILIIVQSRAIRIKTYRWRQRDAWRARKERERELKRLEREWLDARAAAREPDWYGSRESVDVVARAADDEFRAYATPERIAEVRTIHQSRIDRGLSDSWEVIRQDSQGCNCRDCRLVVHVAELVIQEQRDAAMAAQTAYDYSVMEAVRHLSTAAEAAAEPEHRERGAGVTLTWGAVRRARALMNDF
jgi:hypothetical protein